MKYNIEGNDIIITDALDFNIKHICECGQMFRFEKLEDNFYKVISAENCAYVTQNSNNDVKIKSNNAFFFEKYFDLDNNYDIIKTKLSNNQFLEQAVKYGWGIRICNQDVFEMIISFIISANNNIPRIQAILNSIAKDWGVNMGDYYGFPKLDALKNADEKYFKGIGAGYRAKYLADTIAKIDEQYIEDLKQLNTNDARKKLQMLLGVGRKVADCILLFGLHKKDVFPVDTWIDKVVALNYPEIQGNREQKAIKLVERFKELSGYAQQYLFYYKRENNI